MKNIKKLFVAALALTASFLMINAVSAETSTKGSIILNETTNDKTYEVYKIFDLTLSGSGKSAKVAYTIASSWTDFFSSTGIGKDYISDTNTAGTLNQIVVDGTVKYINITDTNRDAFANDAIKYIASKNLTATKSATATTTSVEFTDLDLGYYLVYPQGATDKKGTYGSVASLTNTVPTATINVKAEYPTIDKVADKVFVDVGQIVNYTITGTVPDTTGYNKYVYKVTDTMTEGLLFTLANSNFTVKIDGTVITNTTTTPFTNTQSGNGFVLEFDMTKYQSYVGKKIEITYQAKVTEAAVKEGGVNNSAYLEYSNNPKDNSTKETPKIEIKVYSSAVKVIKVDGANNQTLLSGAEFVLTKTKDNQTLYYQAKDANGKVITNLSTTAGVAEVVWVEKIDDATKLVTDENGNALFKGIANGTYKLVETKAPDGYNKLTKPVEVKVGYVNDEIAKVSVTQDTTIKNNTSTTLPTTGGMGTTLFIVIGSLLAVVSAMILVVNKRMSKVSE